MLDYCTVLMLFGHCGFLYINFQFFSHSKYQTFYKFRWYSCFSKIAEIRDNAKITGQTAVPSSPISAANYSDNSNPKTGDESPKSKD